MTFEEKSSGSSSSYVLSIVASMPRCSCGLSTRNVRCFRLVYGSMSATLSEPPWISISTQIFAAALVDAEQASFALYSPAEGTNPSHPAKSRPRARV